MTERVMLDAQDGHRIPTTFYLPGTAVRGAVQIAHGMAEHAGRYERFANELTGSGFAVAVHDHRGHGQAAASGERGFFAERGGWQRVTDDLVRVNGALRQRTPGVPLALFGHSMGSYVAQTAMIQHPALADALVLSGSTRALRLRLWLGRLAAWFERWRHDAYYPSPSLNAQAFGAFNKRFAPARTDFDWLSRDTAEVDRYVADPQCGWIPTTQLWLDLLGGLLYIGRRDTLRNVPAELPVLIMGGADDPVGGRSGMEYLAMLWRESGHDEVALRIYDGGRHEMLNETNRADVVRDVIGWLERKLYS